MSMLKKLTTELVQLAVNKAIKGVYRVAIRHPRITAVITAIGAGGSIGLSVVIGG